MGILISASQISKSYGSQTLFNELSFSIEGEQKIGLIGPNGAGKTTLLRILAQQENPDSGQVSYSKILKIGYLNQNPFFDSEDTVYSAILSGVSDDSDVIGFALELASRLELDSSHVGLDKKVSHLSGGWQKRVALARELIKKPNLLLLDEPTNHLDIPSIMWLEEYLSQTRDLALLMVTHDRLFLQKTCEFIFDLDPRNPEGLIKYNGRYSDFCEFKEGIFSAQKSLEASRRNTLVRETEWLRRGAIARQTKQKARIQKAEKLADEVEHLSQKNQIRTLKVDFGEIARSPKKIIEAKNISKTYSGKPLFKNFSLLIGSRARIGIIGANGCGKTTLIKTLIGQIAPDEGTIWRTDQMSVSYFEQTTENLDPQMSLLRTICPSGDYIIVQGKPVVAKAYLSRFLFRPDQMDLPVGKLSGGEQGRLLIARLMMNNDSILILDEPTNNLDVSTLDVLQTALTDFPGVVILVTHDRYFMDQVVNQIYAFADEGDLIRFSDFFQWDAWFNEKRALLKSQSVEVEKKLEIEKTEKQEEKKSKIKLSYKDQRDFDTIEDRIQNAEKELAEIEAQLNDTSTQIQFQELKKLTEALQNQQKQIELLYERWQELLNKTVPSE